MKNAVTFNALFEGDYETLTVSITINVDEAEWDCPREAAIFHVASNVIGTEGFERERVTFIPRFLSIWHIRPLADQGLS